MKGKPPALGVWTDRSGDCLTKSYQRLKKDRPKNNTETLVMAVQEQAYSIGVIEAQIYYTRQDPHSGFRNQFKQSS